MGVRLVEGEDAAWNLLAECLASGECSAGDVLRLEGWPVLQLKVTPGDGVTVSPEMMRAFFKVQQAVFTGYSLLKYGVANPRRLSREEKFALTLELRVEAGSTKYKISLARTFEYYFKQAFSRMSGKQAMITTLGTALAIGSVAALSAWLYFNAEIEKERLRIEARLELASRQHAAEVRKEEIRAQSQHELLAELRTIHEQNARQMALLEAAFQRSELVRYAASDYIPWRPALLEVAGLTGSITLNGAVKIPAPVAKKIAQRAKASSKATRSKAIPAENEPSWVTTVRVASEWSPPMRLGT